MGSEMCIRDRLRYAWDFEAQGTNVSNQTFPSKGSQTIHFHAEHNCHAELADALDAARTKLNDIITCWKDAVGPEQDSSMGRSNQACSIKTAVNIGDEGEDEEEEDGENDE